MKFSILACLVAPALVSAQAYGPPPDPGTTSGPTSSAPPAPPPLPSAAPGQHFIQVGNNLGFNFTPNVITAKQGDNVTFLFPTTGGIQHSITQSSFQKPCTLLDGGFDSQLTPNNMEFTITIANASAPIWFFCKQTIPFKHCGNGMVGAINPPSSGNTLAKFQAAASAIGNGEASQTTSGGLSGIGAFATGPPASTSAPAAPAATNTSGAQQLLVGASSLLVGLFVAVLTLA